MIDMVKYVALLIIPKKIQEEDKYNYFSKRLNIIAATAVDSLLQSNKLTGEYKRFDYFKSNELDHQSVHELKFKLAKLYQSNKDNDIRLSAEFNKWISDNFSKVDM